MKKFENCTLADFKIKMIKMVIYRNESKWRFFADADSFNFRGECFLI